MLIQGSSYQNFNNGIVIRNNERNIMEEKIASLENIGSAKPTIMHIAVIKAKRKINLSFFLRLKQYKISDIINSIINRFL